MDSATVAWHYHSLGYDLHLVGFNYGQRHAKELTFLKLQADRLGADMTIMEMGFLKNHLRGSSLTSDNVSVPDGHYAEETMRITVVPNRNAIMLALATGIAVAEKCEIVATGIHAGDHYIYPDCRPAFFEPFAQAMIAGNEGFTGNNFRLEAPFMEMTKTEIAKYGDNLHVEYELTWSCYKGEEIHCGTCGTCYERQEAFLESQTKDSTVYLNKPTDLLERFSK
jgi:7-cyano-7-deazaguanine synthase